MQASDGQCHDRAIFQGFALSLTVPDEAQAEQVFAALANGGEVKMPLAKTFFLFPAVSGMVADRFGVLWNVYVVS